ncbi:hypothetical protein [Streptomyces sp. JJ36]|uniref:hypothetical protein n=1 Tax=Streptomyces sp. JJ36 TaxID=2736645 RepID=UPI001F16BC63|nr:hypothetical protein [Streptomyces sp. JJ36]MCF6524343.1 hypothetical protein [Streptomyces sp. JJ36]
MPEQPQDASPDALTTRIGQAIVLLHGGDREEAGNRLHHLWEESADRPLHRCTIAHYLADTQDDPVEELRWDRRALAAADAVTSDPGAAGEEAVATVRGFYPSLHLNLAADHVKLGDAEAARRELADARRLAGDLAHDAYGNGVRAALDRLELRLADPGPRP